MKHDSYDDACGICKMVETGTPLYANDLWAVYRMPDGIGVPGWMMLLSQRHVGGPAHFNDAEAANFGPALRHFESVLEDVSEALRIYTAALGESFPHFHAHMVPRVETQAGEVQIDTAEATRIAEAYREALAANPPPLT
jgi:diadenosine tetraphosphate (Ap4A) HIT family hydrolase